MAAPQPEQRQGFIGPMPGAPPLWSEAESRALRAELGTVGSKTRIAAANCALKWWRRLITRASGAHRVLSIDVTPRATAPAGVGYYSPTWEFDERVKGGNNQPSKINFTKVVELDFRGLLAQLPENIFDPWWSGGNQLQKVSFEVVGDLGVPWEVPDAPDVDLVFWGTQRRLHLHPSQNGGMASMFQEPESSLAPATGTKRRGKKPTTEHFLIGGQDDQPFMESARARKANGLEVGVTFWPEGSDPFGDVGQTDPQVIWMNHEHLSLLISTLTSQSIV